MLRIWALSALALALFITALPPPSLADVGQPDHDNASAAGLQLEASLNEHEPVRDAARRSKTGPRNLGFGFVAKHRFHFIVGRPRTHVISSLDFGSRVYLRPQWEIARSLAERRLLAERE